MLRSKSYNGEKRQGNARDISLFKPILWKGQKCYESTGITFCNSSLTAASVPAHKTSLMPGRSSVCPKLASIPLHTFTRAQDRRIRLYTRCPFSLRDVLFSFPLTKPAPIRSLYKLRPAWPMKRDELGNQIDDWRKGEGEVMLFAYRYNMIYLPFTGSVGLHGRGLFKGRRTQIISPRPRKDLSYDGGSCRSTTSAALDQDDHE